MEQTAPVVADYGKADDFADLWRTRQRYFLLSMGVGQCRRDDLAGLNQLSRQNDWPVLASRHQVKLVADTLPSFDSNFQKFPKLLVGDIPVRVHELEQAGQNLLDALHVTPGDSSLGGGGIHQ